MKIADNLIERLDAVGARPRVSSVGQLYFSADAAAMGRADAAGLFADVRKHRGELMTRLREMNRCDPHEPKADFSGWVVHAI